MTAGTKAILLLSVFGLVVLVACYGEGQSSNHANPSIAERSADPLLASTSEFSSPRARLSSEQRPIQSATPTGGIPAGPKVDFNPVYTRPPSASVGVKVITDQRAVSTPPAPTLTMGQVRSVGIKAPAGHEAVRAGEGVGRSADQSSSREISKPSQEVEAPVEMIQRSRSDKDTLHVVKPGDTLGHIAQNYYGSARHWPRIADANSDIDIETLRVGMEITIPSRGMTRDNQKKRDRVDPPPASSSHTHTVGDGDTLSSIAEDYLGDQSHWYRIYEINRDRIGNSPDRLIIGMVLVLPE